MRDSLLSEATKRPAQMFKYLEAVREAAKATTETSQKRAFSPKYLAITGTKFLAHVVRSRREFLTG